MNTTPSSGRTHLIADRNYPIDRGDIIADLPRLDIQLYIPFFDGLPTVKCSVVSHPNPVLRIERGDGGRVLLVNCLVILRSQYTNLLGYFWIGRVFLLGEGWHSNADCQPY